MLQATQRVDSPTQFSPPEDTVMVETTGGKRQFGGETAECAITQTDKPKGAPGEGKGRVDPSFTITLIVQKPNENDSFENSALRQR